MDSQWRGYWASTVGSVLALVEVVLWPLLGFGDTAWLVLVGIALLAIGVIFVVVPVVQLKRQGDVAKGESFVNTTALVEGGLYAIVRHPQYVGLLTCIVAVMLIVQEWIVLLVGAVSTALLALDFRKVDADEGAKFGNAYLEYMSRVPGWNPMAGMWRWLRRTH
jgi:protein-S-isoprenylcysteine O-methyltransferase Ste14